MVHRDIKPANVMILPSGQPKIMDFGIAKIETARLKLTAQGDGGLSRGAWRADPGGGEVEVDLALESLTPAAQAPIDVEDELAMLVDAPAAAALSATAGPRMQGSPQAKPIEKSSTSPDALRNPTRGRAPLGAPRCRQAVVVGASRARPRRHGSSPHLRRKLRPHAQCANLCSQDNTSFRGRCFLSHGPSVARGLCDIRYGAGALC